MTSLPGLLLQRADAHPDRVALREKTLGRWREITWADYAARAAAVGSGLRALGVTEGAHVAIVSENRPEWLLADLGADGIGAVPVGIDPASEAAELHGLLRESKSVAVIVEDEEQLDKTLAVRKGLRSLKHIILIETRGVRDLDDPMVTTFAAIEELGRAEPVTGWGDGAGSAPLAARQADEVLSYLPLSLPAERQVSLVDALTAGYVVNFGEAGEPIAVDLREIQPTLLLGVPRVWEEMQETVETRMADASWLKRTVYRAGMKRGRGNRLVGGVVWLVLFRSLREKLGLSRVKVAIANGALRPDAREFFRTIGVPVVEATDA